MGKPGPNCIKKCVLCGDEYHPNSSRQQCCNKPVLKPCVICGKPMNQICTNARQSETCSKECSTLLGNKGRERAAKKLKKVCKYCRKTFIPNSVRDEYCAGPHYATCEVCGTEFEIVGRIDVANKTCSKECRYKSAAQNKNIEAMLENYKATMQKKYGVDNPMELAEYKDKIKATNLKKYGTEFYTQTQEYKEKIKKTNLKKYGVEHHLSSPEVIAKREETWLEKYGAANVFASDYGKAKIKESMIKKYGVSNPGQSEEIQEMIRKNNIQKYGVEHAMMLPEYQEKARQTNFEKFGLAAPTQAHIKHLESWYQFIEDPRVFIEENYEVLPRTEELANYFGVGIGTIDDYLNRYNANDCVRRARSLLEEEITDFIKLLAPDCQIINNNHKVLRGKELDIYLPDYSFAIECNPTITHNSTTCDPWGGEKKPENYHKDKTDNCVEQGIFLMHIFGYDWSNKKEIIKSTIAHVLGCSQKIYARNCVVVSVSPEVAEAFFQQNHLQGFIPTMLYYGLQFKEEMVALMSFGNSSELCDQRLLIHSDKWLLVQFCNRINTSVVGGASKLFSSFIKEYKPTQIISFSDRAHTKGGIYGILGFHQEWQSEADYVWVNLENDQVIHKADILKGNIKRVLSDDSIDLSKSEKEIMESHGYVQVFDSGTITWKWN